MRIERQKAAAHVATIVALTLLLPFVLLQLQSNHKRFDDAYHDLISTLIGNNLLGSLQAVTEGEGNPRLGTRLRLVAAQDFPREPLAARRIGCEPEFREEILVSFQCAVISSAGSADALEIKKAQEVIARMGVPEKLKALYERAPRDRGKVPQILFTHALVGPPEREFLVVFPAVHLGGHYEFQRRPWYGSDESSKIDGISISPLYHDYIYKVSTLTISASVADAPTPLTYGVDLPVTVPSSIFYIYFLNLVFSSAGALVYWRYFISSRSRFLLLLLVSTALVAAYYLIATLNSLSAMLGRPALDGALLSGAFAFFPSGALLVLAGRSLKGRRLKIEMRQFFLWYSFELLAASLDLLSQAPIFDSLFSCISLCVFGIYVFQSRHNYDDARLAVLSPHPFPLSIYMLVSYCFLGAAQFARVFLSSEMPAVWQRVAHLTSFGPYREILLDESSSYLVLMYAKAIAIFATVLYLGAVESARYLRSAAEDWSAPQLDLDQEGRIIRQRHLPASFPNLAKSYFTDLIVDAEDRREVELALREGLPLRSFMCKLGSIFQDRLFRISLIPPSTENGARVVAFRQIDRTSFLRALDLNVSREVGALLKEIESTIDQLGEGGADSGFSRVRQLVEGRGRLILQRTRNELRAMSEDKDELGSPKLSSSEAEAMVYERFNAIGPVVPKLTVQFPDSGQTDRVVRLRISRAVFGVVVDCLFAEMEEVWRKAADPTVRCEYRFAFGCGEHDADFWSLTIATDCGKELFGRFREAEVERMFGLFGALESESKFGNFLLAGYLLEIFNGKLRVSEQREGMLRMCVCLRYYLTSEGGRDSDSA